MKFLGIDYGSKRIGLALSDDNRVLAFPVEVISNDENTLERIAKIIQNENVREIVVGESLNFAGEPNAIMADVKIFLKKLLDRFKLPVNLEKEFLTSVEARRYEDKGENADAKAAALILQRFLDRKNNPRHGGARNK